VDRLPGAVRERRFGPDPQHRDVVPAPFVVDDLALPPGRADALGRGRRLRHHRRDERVRLGPVVGEIRCPLGAEKALQRGQQRLADEREVFGPHREPSVIAPELFDCGRDVRKIVHIGHEPAEGGDETVGLGRHGNGEHLPKFREREEQPGIEELGHLCSVRRHPCPTGPKPAAVHGLLAFCR
jgi:hypothetical protein